MVSEIKIEEKLDKTRDNLDKSFEEMNDLVRSSLDIKKQIRKNPRTVVLVTAAVGFSILALSTKTGRSALKSLVEPIKLVSVAYLSNKAVNFIKSMALKL